ncbi:hypothetical protein MauCBS54593_000669 [Microsporum audouinii]
MPMNSNTPYIPTPPPAFESSIHKLTHPLSPKRRDRHQLSSSEQYPRKSEDEYSPMTMEPGTIEPPLYAKLSISSVKENPEHRPRGWGSRRYPSHDLESGTSGSETMVSQETKPNNVRPIPDFDDNYFYYHDKRPRMGRWRRSEVKYRRWLEGMTQRRRTKLVFQVMLAGMIVGILLGLAFGISDD